MSKAEMYPVPAHELLNLIQVLGLKHFEFAQLCGIAPNTVSHWLRREEIPKFRSGELAQALLKVLPDESMRSPAQEQAAVTVEKVLGTPLVIFSAQGSASAHPSSALGLGQPSRAAKLLPANHGFTSHFDLASISLESLLREIGRRGFKIQIESKGTSL